MNSGIVIRFSILGLIFIAAAWASLYFGGSSNLGTPSVMNSYIFEQIRLPKTLTAIFAGATLSLAGLILQIIFRNPLAGPYVLGVSSGASLMVALGILAGGTLHMSTQLLSGKLFIVACAVAGSLLATLFILFVAKKITSNVILLLIGLMIAQISGALQMSLEYFADPYNLKAFVIWGMGSLSNTTTSDLQIYLPLAIIFVLMLFFQLKPLTAMLYGQQYAENLGFDFKGKRFNLILVSSLLTGITTAFCGPIAFVGIAVPILSRMIFTVSNLWVHFFSCILLGSILLLFADAFANNTASQVSLPINMLTTLIGAPLVIYLMFKNKQW